MVSWQKYDGRKAACLHHGIWETKMRGKPKRKELRTRHNPNITLSMDNAETPTNNALLLS